MSLQVLNTHEMAVAIEKSTNVYIRLEGPNYCRPWALVDAKRFMKDFELCADKYAYEYTIDADYGESLFIEKITRKPI